MDTEKKTNKVLELEGRIVKVLPQKSGISQKTGMAWLTQEYVLAYRDADRERKFCFELNGERIAKFDLKEGDEVVVRFDVEAVEYNNRFFNRFRAWFVKKKLNEKTTEQVKEEPIEQERKQEPVPNSDELPF